MLCATVSREEPGWYPEIRAGKMAKFWSFVEIASVIRATMSGVSPPIPAVSRARIVTVFALSLRERIPGKLMSVAP